MAAGGAKLDAVDFEIPWREGATLPARSLLHERNARWEIHLAVSADRMRAFIRIVPGGNFAGVGAAELAGILNSAGVIFGHSGPGLELYAAIQSGPSPFPGYFQLARGIPMSRGEDGSVEFHVQPTSSQPRYDQSAKGNIDFKQLNLIENCFIGQRIASILPPGPGRAGRDVYGKVLPPRPGVPIEVEAGLGVAANANGREFTAEAEGHLIYEKGVIRISQLLEIDHDVDLRVGNLDFVGKVAVKGSLPDGFYINGKRGVEVLGDMGAARITSEGDVTLRGGVKGKNAAIITCRNLHARYIDDSVVEATGSVTIEKEIVNSNVKALGRVSVLRGAIVGGLVCGFLGVEADSAGSELGVATRIMTGLSWMDENRKEDIRGQVAERQERIESAKILLAPLFADPEAKSRLGNEEKSLLFELVSELRELRDDLRELLQERSAIQDQTRADAVNLINIVKILHQGVETSFSRASRSISDSVKGPLSLISDASGDKVDIVQMQKMPLLKKPAADDAGDGSAGG
ncbi:MAG: FapA family protein [Planctomycetota bacterium]|jgi:uncharacterized protein (DUF342 family)|nr:FapA family protein [Planctomycetota bacterium]